MKALPISLVLAVALVTWSHAAEEADIPYYGKASPAKTKSNAPVMVSVKNYQTGEVQFYETALTKQQAKKIRSLKDENERNARLAAVVKDLNPAFTLNEDKVELGTNPTAPPQKASAKTALAYGGAKGKQAWYYYGYFAGFYYRNFWYRPYYHYSYYHSYHRGCYYGCGYRYSIYC